MADESAIGIEAVSENPGYVPKFGIRPLRAKDVAPMVRIVSKIGLREFKGAVSMDAIASLVEEAEGDDEKAVSIVGVGALLDVAGIVCENFDKAEAEIFKFLASVSGLTVKEVEELPIADLFELVYAVFAAPDFGDFFTRVKALLK